MSTLWIKTCVLTTATIIYLLAASSGYAQKRGPFAKFGGSWNGNGEIILANNTKEVIRCRGNFVATDAGIVSNLRLELKCANAGGSRFELLCDLNNSSGTVTGTWTEITRGLNGSVSGTMSEDKISAVAEGQTFTARLQIISYGDKQHIVISSPGSEISQVLIGLLRVGSKPPQQQSPQTQ